SQKVFFEIVGAMTKLMAPVLSFTAEEIWRTLPTKMGSGGLRVGSVHLSEFPEVQPQWQDTALAERWGQLLEVRIAVQAALENQRREKVIGSSLEADVQIQANPERYKLLEGYVNDLSTVFIVSRVEIKEVTYLPHKLDFAVIVSKAKSKKCERCWNYR